MQFTLSHTKLSRNRTIDGKPNIKSWLHRRQRTNDRARKKQWYTMEKTLKEFNAFLLVHKYTVVYLWNNYRSEENKQWSISVQTFVLCQFEPPHNETDHRKCTHLHHFFFLFLYWFFLFPTCTNTLPDWNCFAIVKSASVERWKEALLNKPNELACFLVHVKYHQRLHFPLLNGMKNENNLKANAVCVHHGCVRIWLL